MKHDFFESNLNVKRTSRFQSSGIWSLLFVVVAILMVAGGFFFYHRQAQLIRTAKTNELKYIAEGKINQLLDWRQERLNDAIYTASGPFIRQAIQQLLEGSGDPNLEKNLQERMLQIKEMGNYQNVLLIGRKGEILYSLDPSVTLLDEQERSHLEQLGENPEPMFSDFIRDSDSNQVYLDVIAPVQNSANITVAFFLMRIRPADYLYPLIQSWPTPSNSAETLLVRKDGSDVLYLNSLRHRNDPPLTIRIPLAQTEIPAVQAVLGKTGAYDGLDYRGEKVLAQIYPIPGTTWFMIAKVDQKEILAEVSALGGAVIVVILLAILMVATLAAFLFNHTQRNLLKKLLELEKERTLAQEEIRMTLYSIGDGVITTDRDGRITRMNPVAEQLTGWTETEAVGQPLVNIFSIINEETREEVENPVTRVLQEGVVVGLANHTLLISKNGVESPIADSGAPIRDEEGHIVGVVLVFRDQTEERNIQRELIASESRFSSAFISNPMAMLISRLSDETILDVNDHFLSSLGFQKDEVVGRPTSELNLYVNRTDRDIIFHQVHSNIPVHAFETILRTRDGDTRQVLISVELIDLNHEPCIISTFLDVTETKLLESQLRKSQAELQKAQSIAKVGSWKWSFTENKLTLSDELFTIWGMAPEKIPGRLEEAVLERLHPDDRPVVEQSILSVMSNMKPAPFEFRIVLPDKSIRIAWNETGDMVLDENDKPLEITGIVQDITEREQMNMELQQSQEKYRYLVELSPDAVFVNRGNRVDFVNPAALVLFGATVPEQIIGKTPYDLFHPDFHETITERIRLMLEEGVPVKMIEEQIMRLDGSVRDVEVTAAPFTDSEGMAIQVLLRDVTERKQVDRKLTEQLNELRRWNSAILGRESRVLELKSEVNSLLAEAGKPARYLEVDSSLLTPQGKSFNQIQSSQADPAGKAE